MRFTTSHIANKTPVPDNIIINLLALSTSSERNILDIKIDNKQNIMGISPTNTSLFNSLNNTLFISVFRPILSSLYVEISYKTQTYYISYQLFWKNDELVHLLLYANYN